MFRQVEETVGSIWSQLDEAQPPASFMPMQVQTCFDCAAIHRPLAAV